MQPIFMSPSYDQAKGVQTLLSRHEIDASIIEKSSKTQESNEKPIKWFELWLRKNSEIDRANVIVTQYEFHALRSNINAQSTRPSFDKTQPMAVTDSATNPPVTNDVVPATSPTTPTKFHNVLKGRKIALEGQLPINNKSVFQRLATVLGVPEDDPNNANHNNVLRPWNSKSLLERVNNLRQLTK